MSTNPTEKANDAFIRVFLSKDTKNEFKVNCAKENTPMSEKARQLIEQWNEEFNQEKSA